MTVCINDNNDICCQFCHDDDSYDAIFYFESGKMQWEHVRDSLKKSGINLTKQERKSLQKRTAEKESKSYHNNFIFIT